MSQVGRGGGKAQDTPWGSAPREGRQLPGTLPTHRTPGSSLCLKAQAALSPLHSSRAPQLPSPPLPSRLLAPGSPPAVPRSPGAYRLGAAEGRRGGAQQQAQRGGGGEEGEEEAEEQQRPRSRHGPAERPRGFRAPTWARGRGGTGPHLRRGRGGGAEPGSSVGLRGARPLLRLLLLLLRSPGRAPGPGARCLTLLWQEAAQHSTAQTDWVCLVTVRQHSLRLPEAAPQPLQHRRDPQSCEGSAAGKGGAAGHRQRSSDTAYNIKRTWALFRNLLAILK